MMILAQADRSDFTGWVGLFLALIWITILLNPRWRARWRWGLYGYGPRISAVGRTAWLVVFLALALAGFAPQIGVLCFLGSFVFLVVAAVWDTRRP